MALSADSQIEQTSSTPKDVCESPKLVHNLQNEEKQASVDAIEDVQPTMCCDDSSRSNEREIVDEAGGKEDKAGSNPLWKTSLCSYFRRTGGSCSHGVKCRYAHGENELRPRPDNSWDPSSERSKKFLKLDSGLRVEASPEPREDVLPWSPVGSDGESVSHLLGAELEKCLVNLPGKWASDNLKKFLDTEGILYKTAKKRKGMTVGFVGFENTDHSKIAIQALNGKTFGSKHLKVENVIPRSYDKKPKAPINSDQNSTRPTENLTNNDSNLSPSYAITENESNVKEENNGLDLVLKGRSAASVVTPLAHMSYNDQLEHKKSSLIQTLKRLTRNARKACPNAIPLPEWILKSREIGGLPCKLQDIIESPLVNGYRNKCEFSVGYSLKRKKTVGFTLGNFREGMIAVEEPVSCPNVSRIASAYAAIFQEFLQSSALPVWNRIDNTGFWRQFTVREGRNPPQDADFGIAEVMLIVQVCLVGADNEVVTKEFQKMARAFADGASKSSPPLPLTALVVQDHQGISNAAPTDCPLIPLSLTEGSMFGEKDSNIEARIHDYIGGLRFCISPTAFFQVNTLAAEKLYSLAGDWAELGPDTLLFDICCGTGTIGLTLANRVGMVVGIEMNDSAVLDARRNAEINGIKNCRFVCSKAEDVMGSLLKEYLKATEQHIDTSEDKIVAEDEIMQDSKEHADATEESAPCAVLPDKGLEHGVTDNESSSVENHSTASGDETFASSIKQFKNVVVIVDPPRGGLHPTVIKALRTHSLLKRLVYISCNPESLVANAIEFCTPSPDKPEKGKINRGWRNMSSTGLARHRAKSMPNSEPFRPVKAAAVDLFPHTPHCEMVMLLER